MILPKSETGLHLYHKHMDTFEKLVEQFKKFPGIGPRQARRFAYHLLSEPETDIEQLSGLIKNLRSGIFACNNCFRYFSPKFNPADEPGYGTDISEAERKPLLCPICLDQNRDTSTIMLVTQDTDVYAVEQRKMFNGLYFVIGKNAELGQMNSESIPRLQDLQNQITAGKRVGLKEIILAMNANTEGEHTADIIRRALRDIKLVDGASLATQVRITALGRGLSTGTELEYSDADTLKSAIENRR